MINKHHSYENNMHNAHFLVHFSKGQGHTGKTEQENKKMNKKETELSMEAQGTYLYKVFLCCLSA